MLVRIVRFANLLFVGLFAGFLVTVAVFEQSLRGFDAQVYTQVRQVELVRLDNLAGVLLIPATITTVVLLFRGLRWSWVALALLIVVFAVTFIVNLPINSDQAGWVVQNPPADWAEVRDRWQIAHVVRTLAALGAFAAQIGARRIDAAQVAATADRRESALY
jgi:cell division protein FtsW (lipid II flippase)